MPEVKKHPGGRPTDYSEKFLQTAKSYLVNFETLGDVVPTIEGLADECGKGARTIYNWGEANPEFQAVLDQIIAKQGRLLQAKGLRKETDSGITKLLLSANHDKREKSDQDITSKGEKIDGIAVEFVRAPKNPDSGSV
jgi:hypothetical protein